jgi:hypothetical protein
MSSQPRSIPKQRSSSNTAPLMANRTTSYSSTSSSHSGYYSITGSETVGSPKEADFHYSRSPFSRKSSADSSSPTSEWNYSRRPEPRHRNSSSSSSSPTEAFYSRPLQSATTSSSKSSKEKRNSGTYGPVGRHSNDWLFGGVSVRESIKHALHRDQSSSSKP